MMLGRFWSYLLLKTMEDGDRIRNDGDKNRLCFFETMTVQMTVKCRREISRRARLGTRR